MVEILQAIALLTNHRGAEDTESEKSDHTVEILQAIAFFNEPQRRREHRGRRERSLFYSSCQVA
ncbi:hypothetical protein PQG02_00775 [Nostoc sp. UHCC 0926]|uniref:hypothetical protein n=1 Tax=unclassified Nostoc TaxID=2593658 RepID=UPI00236032C1|nr:hypothetical protein [Nostoc sp. UHCC 0926]WDD32977.1 hypothetical protein PQG02_00775 [Nostoc sp. UHCC 0926]